MPNRLLLLNHFLITLSLALLLVGGTLAFTDYLRSQEIGLIVDAESKDFGTAQVGEELTIPFVFRNHSSRTIHILGYSQC